MQLKLVALTTSLLVLTGCSGSGPSDNTIASCIADANGFEDVGMARENVVMGQLLGFAMINNVTVENVYTRNAGEYVAQVQVEVGNKQINVTEEEARQTAEMMGFREEDGFLFTSVQASYLFMEGSKGWGCQEI